MRCWSARSSSSSCVIAFTRTRGPTRALALYLIVYCLIASFSESGLGGASQYLLDLSVAASLLTFPSATGSGLSFGLRRPGHPRTAEIEALTKNCTQRGLTSNSTQRCQPIRRAPGSRCTGNGGACMNSL